jgi:hypothetical protein
MGYFISVNFTGFQAVSGANALIFKVAIRIEPASGTGNNCLLLFGCVKIDNFVRNPWLLLAMSSGW